MQSLPFTGGKGRALAVLLNFEDTLESFGEFEKMPKLVSHLSDSDLIVLECDLGVGIFKKLLR